MGEPATPIRRRIELTVAEARLRFQQLVRVTGLTGQVTVLVENGRPIAAIVPASDVIDNRRAAP
jgi:prevent-host-death family protein